MPRGWLYGTPATPKGVASFSPGLLYSATLGAVASGQSLSATPKEVVAIGALKHISFIVCGARDATPFGVGLFSPRVSQGSRVRQPWAVRCNPVGIGLKSCEDCATFRS